jgi:flagellar biosynthesis component FlhA
MFYEIKNILSWIEKGKINNLFSDKKIPDVIITDKKNIAVALKYKWKEMTAPIIVDKRRDSYMKKIINNNTVDTEYGKIIKEKYFKIIYNNIIDAINKLQEENITPILIICSPGNRKMIKNITEKINEEVVVLSTSEIPNDIKIEYIYIMKS